MPSKFVVRSFVENGYYHIFHRGNNKQNIFLDTQDYDYFFSLFNRYLSEQDSDGLRTQKVHFYKDIQILAYCILPNHFHIIIQQSKEKSMASFMQVVLQGYTRYYNKKYTHIGHVFQGKYGARLITDNGDLLNVSKYVHCNANDISQNVIHYRYSSAQYYINKHSLIEWLNTEILQDVLYGYFGVSKNNFSKHYKKYLLE